MAISYQFFNSQNHDRVYDASDWAKYFAELVQNGITGEAGSNALKVTATSTGVSVSAGAMFINGYMFYNSEAYAIDLTAPTLKRVDAIMVRLSHSTRSMSFYVKQGTEGNPPIAPIPSRNGSTYDMCLAHVVMEAGSTRPYSVLDKRSDTSLCGFAGWKINEQVDEYLETIGITAEDIAAINAAIATNTDDIIVLKSQINSVIDKTGLNKPVSPTFTDGKAISSSAGGLNTNAAYAYSQFIDCDGVQQLKLSMPILLSSGHYYGLAFYTSTLDNTYISGSGIRCNYNTSASEISSEIRYIGVPATAKYFRTTWIATTDPSYSSNTFSCELIRTGTLQKQVDQGLYAVTQNRLNPNTVENGYYYNLSGVKKTDSNYAATDFIRVKPGEVISALYGPENNIGMRFCTAYDDGKTAIAAKGAESINTYTVPDGVAYIRASAAPSRLMGSMARIGPQSAVSMYQPYLSGDVNVFAEITRTDAQGVALYPLTKLPIYIRGAISYRPLSVLTKGYVCFVSDDGDADLANYSLPMFISKGVPLTCAVMSASEVFQSQSTTDVVIDAVTNHGCEIAQHGEQRWDNLGEYYLNLFFDNETAFFANLGLTAYGAVCPQHYINDTIRVVAGGRFGCVRTGYGYGLHYSSYLNGPRSNVFGLSSQSTLDGDLASQCAALDAAKANNYLRIVHYHENELNASSKTQLEGMIDYAKSIDLTFITLKDIPTIT